MSETLSYQAIRSANVAREADEQRHDSRKKNLLILVLHYLTEEGYRESAQSLSKETNIDLSRYEVCDNVDLDTVLMDYESYYYTKFARYPKITKKLNNVDVGSKPQKGKRRLPLRYRTTAFRRKEILPRLPEGTGKTKPPTPPVGAKRPTSGSGVRRMEVKGPPKKSIPAITNGSANGMMTPQLNGDDSLQGLVVQGNIPPADGDPAATQKRHKPGQIIDIRAMINNATRLNVEEGSNGLDPSDRLLKPLGGYLGYNQEWRELAQVISRDIYLHDPDVRWDDIVGLEHPKKVIKESVVYPIKYPQLFTGILSPWKGLLLYGPPGTGKTLLAKAVATECNTTFFNISASSIVSKWRGDSEKLVRVLFELARFHAPSTIFLDELESVMSQRGSQGGGGEHEGSRRMKTELLVQMDGLAKTDDLVFLLAASNLPWELDHAMLRRLEKRILVDLPTLDARKAMFQHHLPAVVNSGKGYGLELKSDLDYDLLAKRTDGYSGSDIRLVCKEAAMRPVRKIFDALENHTNGDELHIKLDTIRTQDVTVACQNTKPSARNLTDKYLAWQKEYESL